MKQPGFPMESKTTGSFRSSTATLHCMPETRDPKGHVRNTGRNFRPENHSWGLQPTGIGRKK